MQSPSIKIGKWLPDLPALNNPGCVGAKNVIYSSGNYLPLSSVSALTDALADNSKGAISVKDSSGNIYTFAGTEGGLYQLNSSEGWDDVSKSGGYSTSSSNVWKFALYGNLLIATNFDDNPQKFELGVDSQFSDLTTAFRAKYVEILKNRVVFAYTYDSTDGTKRNRVRWSALDGPTDYTISATTGADFQDVEDITEIKGLARCRSFIGVIGETVISRMEYVGYPAIFGFQTAEQKRGAISSGSIISDGSFIYYLGKTGFYSFDGTRSIPIGYEKVDKSFFKRANVTVEAPIHTGVDLQRKLILWNYFGKDDYTSYPNKLIIYNYLEDAWSEAEISGYLPINYLSSGYTLEELDDFGDLDSLPFSLDSDIWRGGTLTLGLFTFDNKLGTFTGESLAAELITKELQINKDGFTYFKAVYPESDANITACLGYRNSLNDDVVYEAAAIKEDNGAINFENEAKYHRLKFATSGNYSEFQSVKISTEMGGEF